MNWQQLREKKGLPRPRLAKFCNLPLQTVIDIEMGSRQPTPQEFTVLERVLLARNELPKPQKNLFLRLFGGTS